MKLKLLGQRVGFTPDNCVDIMDEMVIKGLTVDEVIEILSEITAKAGKEKLRTALLNGSPGQ